MRWLFPAVLIVAFPFLFVSLWCFVAYLLSKIGGWSALATQFRTEQEPNGKRFHVRSGSLGWVHYGNCLTIVVNEDSLYLAVPFLFRFGHPPLSIPWSEFHNLREKKVLLFRSIVADVGTPVLARVTLPLDVVAQKPAEPTGGG